MRLRRHLWWLLALSLWACGQQQTQYGPVGQVRAYMGELRLVLQELRALEVRLAEQIQGDAATMSVIIPRIEADFRPTIAAQLEHVQRLNPPTELESLHILMQNYLQTRLDAYDLALRGAREKRYQLFGEFARRQAEADAMRPDLDLQIQKVRQATAGR